MGTIAARTLDAILDNVEGALACELLCALAATDFRRPLRNGAGTQIAYDLARITIEPLASDRVQAGDIESARALIASGELAKLYARSFSRCLRTKSGEERRGFVFRRNARRADQRPCDRKLGIVPAHGAFELRIV